jgi:hypothetical protein
MKYNNHVTQKECIDEYKGKYLGSVCKYYQRTNKVCLVIDQKNYLDNFENDFNCDTTKLGGGFVSTEYFEWNRSKLPSIVDIMLDDLVFEVYLNHSPEVMINMNMNYLDFALKSTDYRLYAKIYSIACILSIISSILCYSLKTNSFVNLSVEQNATRDKIIKQKKDEE